MKTKELRAVVKVLVRECLNEVLAEKFLESKITESVSVKPKTVSEVVDQAPRREEPKQAARPQGNRKLIMEKLGINENDPMAFVFDDTAKASNPITTGEEPDLGVTENGMKKAGAFNKDWSKFL